MTTSVKFPRDPNAHINLGHQRTLVRIDDWQRATGKSDTEVAKLIRVGKDTLAEWRSGSSKSWSCSVLRVKHVLAGGNAHDMNNKVPSVQSTDIKKFIKRERMRPEDLATLLSLQVSTVENYITGAEPPKPHFRFFLHDLIGKGGLYTRAWRAEVNWAITHHSRTQVEAAKRLDVGARCLGQWLAGTLDPAPESMARILARLPLLADQPEKPLPLKLSTLGPAPATAALPNGRTNGHGHTNDPPLSEVIRRLVAAGKKEVVLEVLNVV